ncbi:unnamed protein product [Schistocephalus solidus]|uniref:Mpv17-like protein 2 n=1 Tax=Schistocephalus solidus TaxID=70667 RepID=A0A183T2G4_SCHSO|nr:unnamed protein product [Schistocephalus solidus]
MLKQFQMHMLFLKRLKTFNSDQVQAVWITFCLPIAASKGKLSLEGRRTAAFGCTSLLLAPSVHYWYLLLDRILLGNTGSILLRKLFYDAVIFSPFYIAAFYALQNKLEGDSQESFLKKLNSTGIQLWASESVLWLPVQYVNFRFVPLMYRVFYDNFVSFCFDVFYSYMYHIPDSPSMPDLTYCSRFPSVQFAD